MSAFVFKDEFMDQESRYKVWSVFSKLIGMDKEDECHSGTALSSGEERRLLEELSSLDNYNQRKVFIKKIDVEKELNRVMMKSRKHFFLCSLVSWRAAVIFLPLLTGLIAIYVWKGERRSESEYVNHLSDVNPGTLGAVLVMSDGTSRELLSMPDQIEEQDGSAIKVDSTRLNYLKNEQASEQKLIYNKLLVGKGYEYMLVLSDGTKVWMNSASELQYPVVFGKESRRVRLSGEAYFEVTKDSIRPFIVEVDRGFEVKVLGTHFNIKAYDTDDCYETTLVEGKVQVFQENGTRVTLEPSEQMVIGQNGKHEVRVVNTSYYIAWHEGWFYFNDESLEQVLTMIGRWYDIDFNFEAEGLNGIAVTGKLRRFENLSVILKMLEKITGARYNLTDRMVTVSRKNNRE